MSHPTAVIVAPQLRHAEEAVSRLEEVRTLAELNAWADELDASELLDREFDLSREIVPYYGRVGLSDVPSTAVVLHPDGNGSFPNVFPGDTRRGGVQWVNLAIRLPSLEEVRWDPRRRRWELVPEPATDLAA